MSHDAERLQQLLAIPQPIDRYLFLRHLLERDEVAYYRQGGAVIVFATRRARFTQRNCLQPNCHHSHL
jgi:hypothetical protein